MMGTNQSRERSVPGAWQSKSEADQDASHDSKELDPSLSADTGPASNPKSTGWNLENIPQGPRLFPPLKLDEDSFFGSSSIFSKHETAGGTTGSLFGQKVPPSTTVWEPTVSGLFSRNHFGPGVLPEIRSSGLFGSRETDPPRAGLFSQTTSFDGGGLKTMFPPTSSTAEATREVGTQEGFMAWVQEFLDMQGSDIVPVAFHLQSLWDSVAPLADSIGHAGAAIADTEFAIGFSNKDLAELQQENVNVEEKARLAHAAFTKLQTQLSSGRRVLGNHEPNVKALRNDFLNKVCMTLETLARHHKTLLELKDGDIAKLNTQILTLEESAKKSASALAAARDDIVFVDHERSAALSQVKEAHNAQQRLMSVIQELKDKNAISRAQMIQEQTASWEQFRAKANQDAQAKSLQHSKAIARVEELERQVATFEKEKMDLNMAKAAVEKTCEDLTAKAQELAGFKDGYSQLQSELDELRIANNDITAERDELQERMNAMAIAEKDAADREIDAFASKPTSSFPHHARNPHISESDRLDGLAKHWENRLEIKREAIEKKKADIASVDAEIAEARRRVSALSRSG